MGKSLGKFQKKIWNKAQEKVWKNSRKQPEEKSSTKSWKNSGKNFGKKSGIYSNTRLLTANDRLFFARIFSDFCLYNIFLTGDSMFNYYYFYNSNLHNLQVYQN